MNEFGRYGDVGVQLGDDHVAEIEIQRPPNNFFDQALISSIADAVEALDASDCRAAVLCSAGKHFCAGANFGGGEREDAGALYAEAVRLFSTETPLVAAIQGAAVGGGLGLALMPDFRVAAPEARFSANFARLGFHQGFGLSVTLPRLIGGQLAQDLLYTGRRVPGEEAHRIGLCDRLVPIEHVRRAAMEFAREIAISAPLAVLSIRQTLRGDLPDAIRAATDHELKEQSRLQATEDFGEGVRAMAERRRPEFKGR